MAFSSTLIALAVLGYGLTAAFALFAYRGSTKRRRASSEQLHWAACAVFFLSLVAIRLFDAEERGRSALRTLVQDAGLYTDRWTWQAPLAAIAILVGVVLLAVAFRTFPGIRSRKRLAIWISRQAVLAFIVLFALRMISLHAVDTLLYSGPVRLNWLLDGGLTAAVLLAAALYLVELRRRQPSALR